MLQRVDPILFARGGFFLFGEEPLYECYPHRRLLLAKRFAILTEQTASALLCCKAEEQRKKLKAIVL